jgi:hypothetical protein
LKGTVTIETSGQRYEDTARWVDELGTKFGLPLKSKGAIIFKIEEIYDIVRVIKQSSEKRIYSTKHALWHQVHSQILSSHFTPASRGSL